LALLLLLLLLLLLHLARLQLLSHLVVERLQLLQLRLRLPPLLQSQAIPCTSLASGSVWHRGMSLV
jgi:hypothetical protein